MKTIASAFDLLKDAARASSEDKVPMMGAALAYYTAFSIAPLLVIAIGVVGIVFGESGGDSVFETVRGLVGEKAARVVRAMVEAAAGRPRAGVVATAVGIAALLLGASGVFGQLQEALNVIWKAELRPDAGWAVTLGRRLLSFGMVGVIAFLLLASFLVSAVIAAAGKLFIGLLPGGEAVWQAVNLTVSLGVTSALFALIYKALPEVRLLWRDALVGGFFTSVLFSLGQLALGLYLGKSGVASAYGAAGSVSVFLLWVYYSSQIVLFGAELTRAYVARSGRPIALKRNAVSTARSFDAAAEAGAHDGRPAAVWYALGTAAAAGGVRLIRRGAEQKWRHPVRHGVLGGLTAGAGLALLAALEARERLTADEGGEKGPSLTRRVVSRIPFGVKRAAVVGAVRRGGAEAVREVWEKLLRRG